MKRLWWKRPMDVVGGSIALLVAAPLLVLLAVVVRRELGGPVLFRQQRPGRGGRPFTLVKFRTMGEATGADGMPLPDRLRLTRFGRWLRSTSLDELPELWNVLRGEMSLVGPRPLLMEYLPLYSADQARRHSVRPGMTGWAQIQGRNDTTWSERLERDIWYVDHQRLLLDCQILLRTITLVLSRRGTSASNHATMERFRGNDE